MNAEPSFKLTAWKLWQWCIHCALIFTTVHAEKRLVFYCQPLGGSGLLIWSECSFNRDSQKTITTYLQFTFTCLMAEGCFLPEWNSLKAEKRISHPQSWNSSVIYIKQPHFSKMRGCTGGIVFSKIHLSNCTYITANMITFDINTSTNMCVYTHTYVQLERYIISWVFQEGACETHIEPFNAETSIADEKIYVI